MQKFIANLSLFIILTVIVTALLVALYFYKYDFKLSDIPPPALSNSYSLNEKVFFLHHAQKDADILSFGSSMTLNNICSSVVINELKSTRYLNIASWGMSVKEDYFLLKSIGQIYKLKQLILASNYVDFRVRQKKRIDFESIENYLRCRSFSFYYYPQNINRKDFFANLENARKYRNCIHDYLYLKYDNYGAVDFIGDGFNIDQARWDQDFLEEKVDNEQYIYLDSISKYCTRQHIKLMVFQSPIRNGLYQKLSVEKQLVLSEHVHKVENIVNLNSHVFVNTTDTPWPDSLFVDAIHFSEKGSAIFTRFCFAEIKKRQSVN